MSSWWPEWQLAHRLVACSQILLAGDGMLIPSGRCPTLAAALKLLTVPFRSFIIQAPLCAAASLALHYMLKLPTPPREQLLEKFRRVDFLGAFVFVATITTFLVGLDSGSDLGWRHSTTVATLVATPILFAVFVLIEAKVATNPFTPGHIIFRPSLFPAYVAQFCNPASQLANFFLTPLYFQTVQALSTTTSGSLLVPCTLVGVLCTVVAGLSIKRTGKYFALTVATHVLLVCAVLLLSLGFWLKSLVGEVGGLMLSMAGGGSGTFFHFIAPGDTSRRYGSLHLGVMPPSARHIVY